MQLNSSVTIFIYILKQSMNFGKGQYCRTPDLYVILNDVNSWEKRIGKKCKTELELETLLRVKIENFLFVCGQRMPQVQVTIFNKKFI